MFRPGEESDEVEVARLWRSAWMSANPTAVHVEPLEHWLARVQNEFRELHISLFMTTVDRVAAFMAIDLNERYLHQLFVAPDCQGQGIGVRMLQQVCELCPGGWSLHVAKSNVRARNFYSCNHLLEGDEDVNQVTGRTRIACSWRPPRS